MTDELLDYVDENDNILGQVLRSEIDKKGLIGRIICLLIYNSIGEVLLTKVSSRKNSAGKWRFAVTGHISSGDTPLDTVVREAKEEMGVDVFSKNIEKIMVMKMIDNPNVVKRIDHIYKTIHDGPYIADENEIADFQFMKPEKIDEIMLEDSNFFSPTFIKFWKKYRNI